MGSSYLTNPLEFLIGTLFSLYILILMLRFLLAWSRADFYNPFSQFIVKVTNPVIVPMRRIVPSVGGIDLATIVVMVCLQVISLLVISSLHGAPLGIASLIMLSIAELLSLVFNIFIFAILILALLSWINPGTYNPVSSVLYSITEPVMKPVRRMLPPMGGVDLSPLVAIIGLQVIKMLVIPLFTHLA